MDQKSAISAWWTALLAHEGPSLQGLAEKLEAQAWRLGASEVPKVERNHVANWQKRGTFPPSSQYLQAAARHMMNEMAQAQGAPEDAGEWNDVDRLYHSWQMAKDRRATAASPRTAEANSRKASRLEEVLSGPVSQLVGDASAPDGLKEGFRQGSWLTGGETPEYAPRAVDAYLDERLSVSSGGAFVVIVGPPKSGKTRTLLEALRRNVPHRLLWQLRPVEGALAAVMKSVETDGGREGLHRPEDITLLIDDMQRHDFRVELTAKALSDAVRAGLLVVATLHDSTLANMRSELEGFTFPDGVRLGANLHLLELLDESSIRLEPELNEEEALSLPMDLALQAVVHEIPTEKIARLPELLAAVDALIARTLQGFHDKQHPERAALVIAAIDAHHIYREGASQLQLLELMQLAFTFLHPTKLWHDHLFPPAFDWATDPIGGHGSVHAILERARTPPETFAMFDAAIEKLSDQIWDSRHLLTHANHLEGHACLALARSTPESSVKFTWLRRALTLGEPAAAFEVALSPRFRGLEEQEAVELTKQALLAGEAHGPVSLSILFGDRHKPEKQITWLLKAAEHGLLGALVSAARLLIDLGRPDEAEHWLALGARAGSAVCANALIGVLTRRGALDPGGRWHRLCVREGLATATLAKIAIAGLQDLSADEFATHEELVVSAAKFGHVEALRCAIHHLEQRGDLLASNELRTQHDDTVTPERQFERGAYYFHEGRLTEAEDWLSRAAQQGQPDAMLMLAQMSAQRGDEAGWMHWTSAAADLEDPQAMCALGIAKQHSDPTESQRLLASSADRGIPTAMTAVALGQYVRHEFEEAKDLWIEAARCFDREAYFWLGILASEQGNTDEAQDWYLRAANAGDPQSMLYLARTLGRERPSLARHWAKMGATAEGRQMTPEFADFLGEIYLVLEDQESADKWAKRAHELRKED
ncbi:tetratricopeptide repeat protein [Tessaracoccus aquimaris]|nr:tetratricopeptide repeat protein [Tessaracoccus aquimaris]